MAPTITIVALYLLPGILLQGAVATPCRPAARFVLLVLWWWLLLIEGTPRMAAFKLWARRR